MLLSASPWGGAVFSPRASSGHAAKAPPWTGDLGTVFVTGGSGFVGSRLVGMLRGQGTTVRASSRGGEATARLAALGADAACCELTSAWMLEPLFEGCDTIFHAAGHTPWTRDGRRTQWRDNVDTTCVLLDAARRAGVRTFVLVSTACVVMGEPEPMLGVDETAPLQFPSWAPFIAAKAEAERLVLRADGPAMRTVAVRPACPWGPGSPMLASLAHAAEVGRLRLVGGGDQPMSTCHVDNFCHGAILAAGQGWGGEAYFLSDGEDTPPWLLRASLLAIDDPAPRRQDTSFQRGWGFDTLLDPVAACGAAPKRKRISFRAAWRLGTLLDRACPVLLGARCTPPLTRQGLRMLAVPFTVDIGKAREQLGYAPVVSWAEGLQALYQAARERPAASASGRRRAPPCR